MDLTLVTLPSLKQHRPQNSLFKEGEIYVAQVFTHHHPASRQKRGVEEQS